MAPSRPLAASKQTTESAACTKERSSLNPAVSISRPGHRISKQRRPAAQSKTPAPQPDKILTDVLIAIKPVHLANIVSRLKNHEYRKYRLGDAVTRLWLYETSEGGTGRSSITHIAVIPESIRHTPGSVPTEPFGIGNDDFNAGLKQSKYGYPLLELYELVKPVTLSEAKTRWAMGGAPMGWRYLKADLWEDRWGSDPSGREDKVRRVF